VKRCYWAYGLIVESSLTLPGIVIPGAKPDVVIEQGFVDTRSVTRRGMPWEVEFSERRAILVSDLAGAFEVVGGELIRFDPKDGIGDQVVSGHILGAVIAVVLYHRGLFPIHASSVAIHGAGVCFMGGSGIGKSSLAAALLVRGHALASDDVTAVRLTGSAPVMLPGFRQIKLSPASIEALGANPADFVFSRETNGKGVYRYEGCMVEAPIPVRRIYVLAPGNDPEIRPLSPRSALLSLLANTYVSFRKPRDGNDLGRCEQLIRQTDVRLLVCPRAISLLPSVAERVEADLAGA
jgi:hypothetical protein